jgi:predicted RNase H-like HicB family nuclease
MQSYTIVITEEPEGGGYNVVVPALDGCFTCGDSLVEAIANAHEAIELYIESLVDRGHPIPGDVSTTITTVQVGIPLSVAS